jgi:hypothetical protein
MWQLTCVIESSASRVVQCRSVHCDTKQNCQVTQENEGRRRDASLYLFLAADGQHLWQRNSLGDAAT